MSAIRKERDVWMYYGRVGKRQVHRSLQTKDKRIAVDRQKILDRELGKKQWLDRRMPWKEFERQYLEYAKARKPHGSYKNEELALRRLSGVVPLNQLSDLTRKRAEYFITKASKDMRPASMNFYIRTLRAIFTVAVEWKLLDENPFMGVKPLSADLPSPRILTRVEIAALFHSLRVHAPGYVPLIAFYLMTGMRRSEALALEWKDVNYESGVITVARSKGRRPRLIPMAPAARQILLSRKGEGKPFDWYPHSVNRIWIKVRTEAKLPDVKLHDLRRTFGTMLAQAGVSSLFIQQWMGHTDPTVTREHYIGLPQDTRKQLSSLRRVLPKGVLST